MAFVDPGELPEKRVPPPFERALKVVMSPETEPDVKDFTLIYSTLAPQGGCTDFHAHEESGELMVFTSGKGKAWLAGVERDVMPGTAMYAAPGVEHRTVNTGDEPLMIVCVFVPPAPPDYISSNVAEAGHKDGGDG
jgi:mannose-6-phosphate isomerase-like protein (cupin superfamily)